MADHQNHNHHLYYPPAPPAQQVVPPAQPGPLPQLNWSLFKPEFAGKPDEDAESHRNMK